MKVIYKKLPSKRVNCVATIGTFDGIHKGHQFILGKVKTEAKKRNIKSLVITFDLAPKQFLQVFTRQKVLRGKHRHNTWRSTKSFSGALCDSEQKANLIKPLGIDYLWFLKTNRWLLELKPEAFLKYIFGYFAIKRLIVGEDFRFGYAGRGGLQHLKKLTSDFSFKLTIVAKRKISSKIISSSLIRQYVRAADFKKVKLLLGREFSLKGRIVKGRGVGKLIHFPTANIFSGDYLKPSGGVYAAYVILNSKRYLAAVNIGQSPTLTVKRNSVIEAHIINFNKNILAKTIEVVFLKRLRAERKFSTPASLQSAIAKDIRQITAKYSIPS